MNDTNGPATDSPVRKIDWLNSVMAAGEPIEALWAAVEGAASRFLQMDADMLRMETEWEERFESFKADRLAAAQVFLKRQENIDFTLAAVKELVEHALTSIDEIQVRVTCMSATDDLQNQAILELQTVVSEHRNALVGLHLISKGASRPLELTPLEPFVAHNPADSSPTDM